MKYLKSILKANKVKPEEVKKIHEEIREVLMSGDSFAVSGMFTIKTYTLKGREYSVLPAVDNKRFDKSKRVWIYRGPTIRLKVKSTKKFVNELTKELIEEDE